MRAASASAKSKSLAASERAGFHTVRSCPFTSSRLSSMAFSSWSLRVSLSCTAQIARIEPTSARCAPRSACRFRRCVWSSVSFIGCPFRDYGLVVRAPDAHPGGPGVRDQPVVSFPMNHLRSFAAAVGDGVAFGLPMEKIRAVGIGERFLLALVLVPHAPDAVGKLYDAGIDDAIGL